MSENVITVPVCITYMRVCNIKNTHKPRVIRQTSSDFAELKVSYVPAAIFNIIVVYYISMYLRRQLMMSIAESYLYIVL
jgi:hypothetical protein